MNGHVPTQVSGRGGGGRCGSQNTIDRDTDLEEQGCTLEPSPQVRGDTSSALRPETDKNAIIDELLSDVISSHVKPAKAARQTAWSYAWTSGGTPEAPVASEARSGSPRAKKKKTSQDAPEKRSRHAGSADDSVGHSQRTQSKKLTKTSMQASGNGDSPTDHYVATCNHHDASNQVNLYEYEKAKPVKQNRYTEYYRYHRDLHPYNRRPYGRGGREEEDEEEDDQFNVFICLLFCIMGLGVIIGLIILLCQYVDQKEQEQAGMGGPVDENYIGLLNSVYYKRLAQLIERVDNTTLAKTRLKKKTLELCPLESPYIVEGDESGTIMKTKRTRTYTEICVFGGCFLLVFLSVVQIIAFSHRSRNAPDSVRANVIRAAIVVPGQGVSSKAQPVQPNQQKSAPKARGRARAQMEVRELEKALAKLMRESTMTPDEAYVRFLSDQYTRRVQQIIRDENDRQWKDAADASSHPERANATDPTVPYGVPFTFRRSTSSPWESRHVAEGALEPDHRLVDFDQPEARAMSALLSQDNFTQSHEYEDNYNRAKSQFKEGTELFVDEEKLKSTSLGRLDVCPKEPASLVGNSTEVNLNISVDIDTLNFEHSDVARGGEWRPTSCISRHRVAIIVPYRDRWNHLKVLLHYLIPTLKRQQIHFRIFVVEQHGNETFNKGRIMNAAFREALQLFDFQCVTFHDVDLVPEDDRNMYSCTEQPKHMSISIDKFQYTLPYQGLVGGVLMFRTDHFQLVNGYSNMYWGWGAEDDDMTTRILHRGLRIYRPPSNIARYKMVKHEGRKGSEVAVRMKLLRSAARRSKLEGLNNVQYKIVSVETRELFTHFTVDIGTP